MLSNAWVVEMAIEKIFVEEKINVQRKTVSCLCLFDVRVFCVKRKQMKRKWSEYSFKRKKRITEKTQSHETLHIIYPFTAVFLVFFFFFFILFFRLVKNRRRIACVLGQRAYTNTNTCRREKSVCRENDELTGEKRALSGFIDWGPAADQCNCECVWVFFGRSEWLARIPRLYGKFKMIHNAECF